MPREIVVPPLGESIVEATVGRWLKQPGDTVSEGDVVVELETEKVNLAVTAPAAGVLAEVARAEGVTVKVGEVLGSVGGTAGSTDPVQSRPVAAAAPSPSTTVPVNARSEPSTTTGSEADARPRPPAPSAALPVDGPSTAPTSPDASDEDDDRREPPPTSPSVRRLAVEHDIDLAAVTGSGPGGRIVTEDVIAFLAARDAAGSAPKVAASSPPATPPAQPVASDSDEERVRLTRRRQTIARRLVEAQQTTASLTTFNEVDLTAVMALRARHRDKIQERHGVRLGFMSFFVKASIAALKAFPRLNAEIDGDEMVLKHRYHVGVAVSTEEGLVVPVVRDADRKSFVEIDRAIESLAERARSGKLSIDELRGGTFTITNGGVFGSLLSTPILNPPQVGILGMHKIQERPIALEGAVVIRPMMYVALTYDHRIVDGREAVQFLVRLKDLLESPEGLMLET